MKQIYNHRILSYAMAICFLFLSFTSLPQTSETKGAGYTIDKVEKKRVLVLNSYHEGYHWTDRIMRGIHSVLSDEIHTELYVNYMDTKRCSDSIYFSKLKQIYAHKFRNIYFDAIISTDDYALDFILSNRDSLFANTPVVFCGINDFEPERISGHKDITGICESDDIPGTIQMILQIQPDIKSLVVVSDSTFSGMTFLTRTQRIQEQFKNRLNFTHIVNASPQKLAEQLQVLDSSTAVVWEMYLRRPNGFAITSAEGVQLTVSNTKCPVYCVWDVVGKGVLGGKVTDPVYQGKRAAEIIEEVLLGKDINTFPIESSAVIPKFDYQMLKKHNISIKSLPKNSIIINHSFSFWYKYRILIIITLSIIGVLLLIVASLLYHIQKRYQAENLIRLRNTELEAVGSVLRESNLHLEDAIARAEQGDRLKTMFLANLSHEIRTPMNGIMGFANLLKMEGLPKEKYAEYLDIIVKSGERMLGLINNLVYISKIETGQLELAISPLNLNELLDDILECFATRAKEKNLKLSLEKGLKDDKSDVLADHMKLEQMLVNLIENALKFTKEGEVRFGYELIDNRLQFWVRDTGIGISSEIQEFIFDRFNQADDIQILGEGIGLGLSISKAFVELMNGKIWVESEPGIGSCFFFYIPFDTESKFLM